MPDAFGLSVAMADILGDRLRTDIRRYPLEIPYIGRTEDERAQVTQAGLRGMEADGLAYRGRPDADVEAAIQTLGRSTVAAAMVLSLDRGNQLIRARVAANGGTAILVLQHENMLHFKFIRPTGLVPALMNLVPNCPPLAARSVTFPRTDARQPQSRSDDDDGDSVLRAVMPRNTGGAMERQSAARMLALPRERAGSVLVFGYDRNGREHQAGMLAWADTPEGRFMSAEKHGSDGVIWETHSPADNQRVGHHISGLLSAHA